MFWPSHHKSETAGEIVTIFHIWSDELVTPIFGEMRACQAVFPVLTELEGRNADVMVQTGRKAYIVCLLGLDTVIRESLKATLE